MVSVGSMSQLERMGSELRCPICLSLYKNAATISCNHTFCRSCILESMRSTACCPVCKTHTTRREVRPAPQMDSLVEIFRGLETSAGVCLFPTQSFTQPAHPCKELDDEKSQAKWGKRGPKVADAPSKKTKATNKSLDPRKKRRRVKSDQLDSADGSDVDENLSIEYVRSEPNAPSPSPPRGVVLAKKRVQVPQSSHLFLDLNLRSGVEPERTGSEQALEDDIPSEYRPSTSFFADPAPCEPAETDSRPGLALDLLKNPSEVVSPDRQQEVSQRIVELLRADDKEEQGKPVDLNLDLELQGFPSLRQAFNELPQLTPFFWLPNDFIPTQDEQPTQTQLSAQPVRPAFSDLKDSDDDGSLDDVQQPAAAHERGFGEEGYDSDTFEWTQRPCSPELSCSPTRYGLQACSTRSIKDQHVDEIAFKHEVNECTQGLPSSQGRLVGAILSSEVHLETLSQRVQKAPNRCTKSLSDRKEDIHPQNVRRSLRARTSNPGASLFTPGPVGAAPTISQSKTTSGARIVESISDSKHVSNESKDCADAAKRFLSLLRDGHPEVAPQPPPGDDGSAAPKLQVGEKFAHGGKAKAVAETVSPVCRFCGSTGNSEVAGEMMRYQMGTLCNKYVHVHKLCAEWAPNVYFEEDDCPKNLVSEISRGSRIKCIICGKKGAALGCCNNKCKNSYHYPCARLLDGCQWNEEDYVMFCPQHARGRFPKGRRPLRDSSNSTTETEPIEVPSVSDDHIHARGEPRTSRLSDENKALKWVPGPVKWVLCGSGLDSQLKAQVASFASLVGATLVKDWTPAVTHVISGTSEQGAAKRTLKYLLAMLEGKWIVKTDWMNECISKRRPVAEEPYLVTSDVNGCYGGPCLSRHLAVSQAPKLFEGLSFYLCADFTSALKADLHALITAGSGTVLHRKPLTVSSYCELSPPLQDISHPGQTIVLYNGEADSGRGRNLAQRIQEAMSVSIPAGAHALPCSWLLDSIAHCRLLPPN